MDIPIISTEERTVALPRGVQRITGLQVKAARAVLGHSVNRLAGESGISRSSIRRIEDGQDEAVKLDLVMSLQTYFERRGFTFLREGRETGVKWRRP